MENKLGNSLEYSIYKTAEEIYLRFMRIFLKEKMRTDITEEKKKDLEDKIKEVENIFQRFEDWWKNRSCV